MPGIFFLGLLLNASEFFQQQKCAWTYQKEKRLLYLGFLLGNRTKPNHHTAQRKVSNARKSKVLETFEFEEKL